MHKIRKKMAILAVLLIAPLLLGSRHSGPAYDRHARESLDAFAQEFAKKHQLKFLNTGVGSLADAKEGIWIINFVSNQTLTIEEARLFAADLTYQLLYKVYHDRLFINYCKISAPFHKSADMREEYVGFRLAFWDQNTNRPLYPCVAQIRLADGNLYYHYANPNTQALQEPLVESLAALELPLYR